MATTAWKICGTADLWDHDSDAGGDDWVNAGNATADDNTDVTTRNYGGAAVPGTGKVLRCKNFGFTSSDIPSGATINGIEVRLGDAWRSAGTITIVDSMLQLIDEAGALVGSNISTGSLVSLTGTRTNFDVGGASNLWGWTSVSDTKLQDADMGVAVNLVNSTFAMGTQTGAVDFVAMRVHYTAAGGGRNPGGDMMPFFN